MAREILYKIKLLNQSVISYSLLNALTENIATQLPHPWFAINYQKKKEILIIDIGKAARCTIFTVVFFPLL
ncbi:hypothetical protein GKODMF_11015 [Candidatus Electrothrix gigas]